MKKLLCTLLCSIVVTTCTYSQQLTTTADSKILEQITRRFQQKNAERPDSIGTDPDKAIYQANYINEISFDSIFKPIYGKVMLGNTELVNQGSAVALTGSQFDSKFSLNYNWAHSKDPKKALYYNAGFAATTSDKFFQIYAKDQWQQSFGVSFGITQGTGKRTLIYRVGKDFAERKKQAILSALKETQSILSSFPTEQIDRLNQIDISTDQKVQDILSALDRVSLSSVLEIANAERKKILRDMLHKGNSATINNYVDSCLSNFEISYFKELGYKLQWWNALIRPEYKGVSIYDTVAARLAGIKRQNYLRLNIEGSYNRARNTRNWLVMQTFAFAFKNTNYLEGKMASQIDFLQNQLDPTTSVKNIDDAVVVENYDEYKKQFLLFSPTYGINVFYGKARMFGWEFFGTGKFGIGSKSTPFNNLFTARTGFLFSMKGKTDIAKSTIGLITQWEDVEFRKASWNRNFTFSIRIGIPFNI